MSFPSQTAIRRHLQTQNAIIAASQDRFSLQDRLQLLTIHGTIHGVEQRTVHRGQPPHALVDLSQCTISLCICHLILFLMAWPIPPTSLRWLSALQFARASKF